MSPYEREDWKGFIEAIRRAPDDDLPRLVAADYLEENGEARHAELIRLQCELAKRATPVCCERPKGPSIVAPVMRCRCQPCRMKRRENQLLAYKADWLRGMLHVGHRLHSWWVQDCAAKGLPIGPRTPQEFYERMNTPGRFDILFSTHSMQFRRGFVESIRVHESNWLEWREVLRAALPLRSVVVMSTAPVGVDRSPWQGIEVLVEDHTPLWERAV